MNKLEPFRTKGEYQDEVSLLFDDGKELFVSATFLKMSSPVFKAMLESEFKEKSTGVIRLSGKKYDELLDLLEFLHHGVYKPITEKTVHKMLPLAHEYQVTSAITVCRNVLSSMICNFQSRFTDKFTNNKSVGLGSTDMAYCLTMLAAADKYLFDELKTNVLKLMQSFKSYTYTKNEYQNDVTCTKLFASLSENVKLELLLSRLKYIDNYHSH